MLKIKNFSDTRRNKKQSNKVLDKNKISFNKMWVTNKGYIFTCPHYITRKIKNLKINFWIQNNYNSNLR